MENMNTPFLEDPEKRRTAIVDIDSTLANIDHRLNFIGAYRGGKFVEQTDYDNPTGQKKDWESFHAKASDDSPIWPTITLVNSLSLTGWFIILCTGRSAESYDLTVEWLEKHAVSYDLLLMRPFGDHRSKDVDLKRAWLNDLRQGRISVPGMPVPCLAIEDRKRCVDMWREEGLVALQCDVGDF